MDMNLGEIIVDLARENERLKIKLEQLHEEIRKLKEQLRQFKKDNKE